MQIIPLTATTAAFGVVRKTFFVLLAKYCAGDKMEKNEMGWACGAYG
jgi:hypothetical protein